MSRLVRIADSVAPRKRKSWFEKLPTVTQQEIRELVAAYIDGTLKPGLTISALARVVVENVEGLTVTEQIIRHWIAERIANASKDTHGKDAEKAARPRTRRS